jgi:outer membrane protein assembly factor BamB
MLGQLLVVDMADGTVRWSRAITDSTGLAAAAGLVLYGSGARLTAYDDRSGVPRWTAASMGTTASWSAVAAGTAGVAVAVANLPAPGRLYLLDPATGRVRWEAATW